MSSLPKTRTIAAALVAGAMLGACSDIYWDRRESVALGGGDAVQTNKAIQMVDPWPPQVANKNIAFNGQRMQSAVDHYRNNRVVPPVIPTTTSNAYQASMQNAVSTAGAQQGFANGQTPTGWAAPAAAPTRGP
jgi:hypothetical protein